MSNCYSSLQAVMLELLTCVANQVRIYVELWM